MDMHAPKIASKEERKNRFTVFVIIFAERLSDVIPDRGRGWIERMMVELASRINYTAGRGW